MRIEFVPPYSVDKTGVKRWEERLPEDEKTPYFEARLPHVHKRRVTAPGLTGTRMRRKRAA